MSEIASGVKAAIVDKLGVEESEITSEASFTNDLGADSPNTVEPIMEFEEEFGISIPDDQAERIGIVDDAIFYIEEHAKQFDLINVELKKVVIAGLGAITPVGNSVPEFWEDIMSGVSGAGPIAYFDASLLKAQSTCKVKDFDATKYIGRKEARRMDLYTQYTITIVKEAMNDSGLDVEKGDLNKIGVIFGADIGGMHIFEEEIGNYYTRQEMDPEFNPFFIPKTISNIAAGQISIMYGFHGPNYATCSACTTLTSAIADAFSLIRLDKANVVISGGSRAAIFPAGVGDFNAMHALSTHNDETSRASRPFSASRNGFIMGEGGGCLILKELEHTETRGAEIYAEVTGVGISADAHHLTASHPEGLGAKLVMMNALEDTETGPEEIDYINIHGTSTPVGDISEAKTIKEVFGDHAFKLNISSTKSMTGHLPGVADAVESIVNILAIKSDIALPTINREEGDDDENIGYNLNFTFNKAQKREVNVALSNIFGFGGHNVCAIFKKYAE